MYERAPYPAVLNHPMSIALSAAVPLWIMDLRAKGGPDESDVERAREFSQALSEKGDVLQFAGRNGEAAGLFNRLAHAVAVMAFKPGGIYVFGQRWEEIGDEGASHL